MERDADYRHMLEEDAERLEKQFNRKVEKIWHEAQDAINECSTQAEVMSEEMTHKLSHQVVMAVGLTYHPITSLNTLCYVGHRHHFLRNSAYVYAHHHYRLLNTHPLEFLSLIIYKFILIPIHSPLSPLPTKTLDIQVSQRLGAEKVVKRLQKELISFKSIYKNSGWGLNESENQRMLREKDRALRVLKKQRDKEIQVLSAIADELDLKLNSIKNSEMYRRNKELEAELKQLKQGKTMALEGGEGRP